MTMQLQGIAIYSNDGERRDVRFDLGRLNIVTGAAKTGKSALLGIVDYCWGREEAVIPGGEIRRAVSWFAVLFDVDGEGVLVARANAPFGPRGSDQIYVERNVDDFPENPDRFVKTETLDGLRSTLSALLGITENLFVPEPGALRVPLEASASQAILFCLQEQDEIANKRQLFHRQGEERLPQAIKDAIPYFVGAIEDDHYLKQRRRQDARARLRRLVRELEEAKALSKDASQTARTLATEARRLGLASGPVPDGVEETRAFLRQASAPRTMSYARSDRAGTDLADLEDSRRKLRGELQEIRNEIRELQRIRMEVSDFEVEGREQEARLVSIGLVNGASGPIDTCPLCAGHLDAPIPAVAELKRSLEGLDLQLATARRDNPRLQKRIAELEERRTAIDGELSAVQTGIQARISQNERLRIEQDQLTEQARLCGRIEYFLENVHAVVEDRTLGMRISRIRAELDELDRALDQGALEERLITALNLIGRDLTDWATELQLEHGDRNVRLDRRHLTIVADTLTGPLPLSQIGSGENWVGYHVATHLALHKLFRARNRPVPAFLMLDQPSQAHYPRDRDVGEIGGVDDEDQVAVARLYRLLWEYCDRLVPNMQIVVTDHVDLMQDWFQDSVQERWRDGIKLVPVPWLKDLD
ncbi:DUF3732 domain-containing protein [Sphingomonas pseudosanguinis]|uniref:Chaperonin cofactor prefoldin n=1 Tax=Sphingomonas pseudosanguinis TaxID=413712 RepID=A0A7W6A602_9SPHN|nr:DUF3732 domain-containing protein [Sphingomonas pseudosanguinis]MBB3877802.1 chaperonin cofactor prefoldin [Sphingomonas pseudosanguinis]MBN3537677.1 DUF3732 domain-containing protein [Sphingomonas pseudosanguinis]